MTDDARTARLDAMRIAWWNAEAAYKASFHQKEPTRPGDFKDAADAAREAYIEAVTGDAYAAEMRREGALTEHDAMCFTCKPQLPGGCWIRCARGLALSEAERGEAP